jgi:hypothetical protein
MFGEASAFQNTRSGIERRRTPMPEALQQSVPLVRRSRKQNKNIANATNAPAPADGSSVRP